MVEQEQENGIARADPDETVLLDFSFELAVELLLQAKVLCIQVLGDLLLVDVLLYLALLFEDV